MFNKYNDIVDKKEEEAKLFFYLFNITMATLQNKFIYHLWKTWTITLTGESNGKNKEHISN